MATLALSVAGQALGAAIGGPIGAVAGRALGALAGNAIDQALFGQQQESPANGEVRLHSSSEGGDVPRIYGWNRLAGNIVWATELERSTPHNSGAKGTGAPNESEFLANFAVAFCEGEVAHLGRIWADGRVLETDGLNIRFYPGSQTQPVDGLIVAKQGSGGAPAYRGVCYIVFEGLPLKQFGNRLPVINAELCRVVGDLEPAIRAVSVIPGSTEFGYDPTPMVRVVSPGVTEPENTHALGRISDWTMSINELVDLCPNLEHVALVTSWFGTDLRCGQCEIEPRVERTDKAVDGGDWVAAGLTRAQVSPVTTEAGGPAYGGTPSDASLLAAIADLKARGIKVTLYPFVMMDIDKGNALTDPYTGAIGQPAYPWRGRITCDPAPTVIGSPDKSASVTGQVDAFLGTAAAAQFSRQTDTVAFTGTPQWSYRRFILHYAHLCALAGGVDSFLIGSELRGLTQLRAAADQFPFVEGLRTLAADVRTILGANCRISYAADWSEYSGYQPADAPGDKLFHLDPLWAHPDIDAVSIDNYMPLSDWRDGENAADADAGTPQRLSYLTANIAGGEGYDWSYASEADRQAQIRTPITDLANGEPWVWRYKDLVNWWKQAHHNRSGGVRSTAATPWVPQSKPIWFTELGCAAVDKAGNGPNAFPDPKSSEDSLPPYSNATPDPLMQRQFLRAHFRHWLETSPDFVDASNPVSALYGARMLDTSRIYLWAWDARPFPAFPNLGTKWADGTNYERGHWLNGRLGCAAPEELLETISTDFGAGLQATDPGRTLVSGCALSSGQSARAALEIRTASLGLHIVEKNGGLIAKAAHLGTRFDLDKSAIADGGEQIIQRRWRDQAEHLGRLTVTYQDRRRGYAQAQVTVVRASEGVESRQAPQLVLNYPEARKTAEQLFLRAEDANEDIEFQLPMALAAIEPGDRVRLAEMGSMDWLITEVRRDSLIRVRAQKLAGPQNGLIFGEERAATLGTPAGRSVPVITLLQLPPRDQSQSARLAAAAFARPWPGRVTLRDTTGKSSQLDLTTPAALGKLTQPLQFGSRTAWDRSNTVELELYAGHLSSSPELEVRAGANRLAVQHANGEWELVGFVEAVLTGDRRYRLSQLLRNLDGSMPNPQTVSTGAAVAVLDAAVGMQPVLPEQIGQMLALKAFAGAADLSGTPLSLQITADTARPLAPVHLRAHREAQSGDIHLSWKRCSRFGRDNWAVAEVPLEFAPESYRVEIASGGTVLRTIETGTPAFDYPAAWQNSDFGALPSKIEFSVAQMSNVLGAGHPASAVVSV